VFSFVKIFRESRMLIWRH